MLCLPPLPAPRGRSSTDRSLSLQIMDAGLLEFPLTLSLSA